MDNMEKLQSFGAFLSEKQLYSLVTDQSLIEDRRAYLMDHEIDENLSFVDKMKNSLSKNILGSLSSVKIIDDIIERIEELEKEVILKGYDHEDAVDKIDLKIDDAKRADNQKLVQTLRRERQRKSEEYSSFIDLQKLKIKKGIEILDKTIGGKKRRDEYAKMKLADKDYQLTEYKYELAKKKAGNSEEVKELKDKKEKAKENVENIIKIFKSAVA